jgi:cellulose synthase/poly-beta-1,6-N-acetylglucosamine synthase-like glycosyltransferase
VLVLLIEIISSTATFGYAILLVKYSKSRRTKGLPIPKKGQQPDLDNLKFHVRVLIPCYKESCELVKLTVLGALKAPLPKDTLRTVYLCDDGKDPQKEEMIRELNAEWGCLEYVSGRKRDPNGESYYYCCCCIAALPSVWYSTWSAQQAAGLSCLQLQLFLQWL